MFRETCQNLTSLLPDQNDSHKRNRLLVQYITYACHLPYYEELPLFHEQLVLELLTVFNKRPNTTRDLVLHHSWLFFEILFKSLAIYFELTTNLLSKGKINNFSKQEKYQNMQTCFTKLLSLC